METAGSAQLFAGASGAYRQFPPAYPASLYQAILARLRPPFTRALDIGAGTGISTNALAAVFPLVTAAEPDATMLAKASLAPNVTPLCKSGEDLAFKAGSFQLITCGNAFYWMDGEAMAPAIGRWLEKGGLFAAYRYDMPATDSMAANAVLAKENSAHWDAHRHPRLRDTGYTLRCLQRANCFAHIEVLQLENPVTMAPGALAGFFASTSYGSAYLAGLAQPDAYLKAFAKALGGENEQLTVDFGLELVLARK